jgi:hypothetical protein
LFVDDGSDREPDHTGIMLCGLAPHRMHKACQPTFRCLQKLLALPRPLLGQRRIAASDEPFAGKVGRGDLCQIALVEQGELQWPGVIGECGDLRCPEAADPVEPGWRQLLADPRRRDHAAVADQRHV